MGALEFTNLSHVGAYEGSEALQAMLAAEGFVARQRKMQESHKQRVDAFVRLMGDVIGGNQDPILLREALFPKTDYIVSEICRKYPGVIRLSETMSVTDFANYLTVDVLDRMLWGYWGVDAIPNLALVKKVNLNDFRTVKRFEVDGGVTPFEKQGSPAAPPKERALTPRAPITYAPDLYQGMMSVNWRAIVNDDLGIFNDLVQRLSDSWSLTVWKAITSLYVDTNGPSAALYNSTFKNQVITANGAKTNNPPLDFQGLIDANTVLNRMLNPDGQPFTLRGKKYLWFGPDLEQTAMALLNASRAAISVGGGTTNSEGFPSQRLDVSTAYVVGGMTPVLDKYIPLIATAGTVGNTMWGLTYEQSAQPRPAVEFGMLKGFDTPQLFQKMPNTVRVGGAVDPMMGDFLTMDQNYKGIAVFGGAIGDGRSTVASTGQGS